MKRVAEFVVYFLCANAGVCMITGATLAVQSDRVIAWCAAIASIALAGLIAAVLEVARAVDRGNGRVGTVTGLSGAVAGGKRGMVRCS